MMLMMTIVVPAVRPTAALTQEDALLLVCTCAAQPIIIDQGNIIHAGLAQTRNENIRV